MLEDNYFVAKCFVYASSFIYVPVAYYHYCQNENSYTHLINKEKIDNFKYSVETNDSLLLSLDFPFETEIEVALKIFKIRLKKLIISKCDFDSLWYACILWNGLNLSNFCVSLLDRCLFYILESKFKPFAFIMIFLKKEMQFLKIKLFQDRRSHINVAL